MRINDIVVLGVSAPEDSKKYGKTVCVAAWQKDYGMMRIYPATPLDGFGRWKVFDLDLERPEPKHDTRKESWKRSTTGKAEPSRKVTAIAEKRDILESSLRDCYLELNETRESLCVVRPSEVTRLGFREHPAQLPKTADMIGHHDDWCSSRDTYSHSPFIHYRCSTECAGKSAHKQTVIEWGAFEFMRKHPSREHEYWDASLAKRDDYDTYLVLGNQANHRKSFIVIQVICLKSDPRTMRDARSQEDLFNA